MGISYALSKRINPKNPNHPNVKKFHRSANTLVKYLKKLERF